MTDQKLAIAGKCRTGKMTDLEHDVCTRTRHESDGERILKISQRMVKLWARIGCPTFLTHGVDGRHHRKPTLTYFSVWCDLSGDR